MVYDAPSSARGPEANLPAETYVLSSASGRAFEEISSSFNGSAYGSGSRDSSYYTDRADPNDKYTPPDAGAFNVFDPGRDVRHGVNDYIPPGVSNIAQANAKEMSRLSFTADMYGSRRESGLTSLAVLPDNSVSADYESSTRRDGLRKYIDKPVDDGTASDKYFDGSRSDGLLSEHTLNTSRRQEQNQTFDPTKREDGLTYFKSWKQGDYSSQSSEYSSRDDGMTKEQIDKEPNLSTRTRDYSDGRREVVRVDNDGNSRSEYYDADGKSMSSDAFARKQKELEYSIRNPQ